ncbi:DNA cytosine methyltransferase [Bacillus sp. FJAT-45066]|uniref:DNA cytosine methyltransferase n=1 Tax=Bacillus sp. FJAT-45066 TaxID=2011010 RepID=UPI000BB689D3|nr:DNA cytosine methyltransferase [Bacillus sp. FJAT-45066]
MDKHKVLDLFAGAGGLSLGFQQTGRYETVMAVEVNENAAKTYSKNHKIVVNTSDIRSIDFKDYTQFPNLNGVTIVIGGPPCQGFSNANRQKSELFSNNNLLVKEFVRAIKEVQPVAFVMENVKTINSIKHKFFVTTGDQEEISTIGVNIVEEDLYIGNTEYLNEQLVNLYNSSQIRCEFADSNIITKLKSLIRYVNKYKEVLGFIDKNATFFNRYIMNWESYFNTYNNKELYNLIYSFKIMVENRTSNKDLTSTLVNKAIQIIEIQNITLIFKEIIEKRIESSPAFIKVEKGIYTRGYTYTVIDYLIKTFHSLGFHLDYGVLNAANFGVPQERNRYFIIGNKNSKPRLPKIVIKQEEFFNIGNAILDIEGMQPNFSLSDEPLIKDTKKLNHPLNIYLNAGKEELFNHIVTKSTSTALERFKSLGPGQNFHDLDDSLKTTYADSSRTQNTIYKRLDYNEVCKTVVNVRKSMWIHPQKNRAVSIREAARLQSFPDDYKFFGTKDSQYQQIGNAVPPLLGRAVAESMLECFNDRPEIGLKELLKKEKEAVY